MANIRSFKELRVWKNAMDMAMRVFELTKRFPAEEKYSLTKRCGYIAESDAMEFDRRCEEILTQLVHMISHAADWTISAPD